MGTFDERTVALNHPSHTFDETDDCIRCLDCEVLYGGLQSDQACPYAIERASFEAAFHDRLSVEVADDELRDAGRGHLDPVWLFGHINLDEE